MLFIISSFTALSNSSDSVKTKLFNEITVQAARQNDTMISIGKMKIKEMDLPQSMISLDEKVLKQQQVNSMSDLLKNANGIYIMGNTGGYQEEIASRGSNITTTNTFKNGIRYFGGMKTELSGIEKAELMKGNSAILYGNVAPGGVLNLITKKPKYRNGGSVGVSYGSFQRIKPEVDIYGSLYKSKSIAFRLNASYEQANSFRENVNSKTYYINPSLNINLSKKTSLLLEADFTKSEATPDFGAGIINYEIVEIPRERFLGVTWGKFKAEQSFASAKFSHNFNANMSLSSITGIRYYNTELFSNARPNSSGSVIKDDGEWKRNLQKNKIDDDYFIQQIDFNATFKTGSIKHQSLVGFDLERFTTTTNAFQNYVGYDVINIFSNYVPSNEPNIPELKRNTDTKNPVNRYGFYAQDLMSLTKFLKLLAGVRYTNITSNSTIYKYSDSTTTNNVNSDEAFSPKIGVILQPTENHTFFTSYSNSFTLNTGVDINGNALKPSIIDQIEIGVKNKLFNNKLNIQITAYQIKNSNLAQVSLENGNTNSNVKELAGETRSKGLEVDVAFQPIKSLRILSGYSFNESKYTKSNIYIIGSELRYNPKHTANISLNYEFQEGYLKDLQIGIISTYFGDRYAGRSTRLTVNNDTYKLIALNDYALIDFTMAYTFRGFNFKAKLANAFDVENYNVHDDNSLNPIIPRNYNFSVTYNF